MISFVLFMTAVVNFLTKTEATIAGVSFSVVFFALFAYSEHRVAKERHGKPEQLAQFRVYANQEIGSGALAARPGNSLVAVRDPRTLYYLLDVLAQTDTTRADALALSARPARRPRT